MDLAMLIITLCSLKKQKKWVSFSFLSGLALVFQL